MTSGGSDVALRERLKAELPGDRLESMPATEVEGAFLETRIRPQSSTELSRVLAALNDTGVPALLRGGGSRVRFGHPVTTARVLLETSGLTADSIVDPEDGVAYLPAGAKLSELRERVRKETEGRWELPLDPPGERTTLGGTLATAATGPRSKNPREVVLGLDVTLATGERTRCGGRVVKNVTGYDLAKLYVGSLGTLGVIEAAWLHLAPAPEAVQVFAAPLDGPQPGLRASRLSSVRAAAWLCSRSSTSLGERVRKAEGRGHLVIELAGDQAAVEAEARILRAEIDASEVAEGEALISEIRAKQAAHRPGHQPDDTLEFRLSSLPSCLGSAAQILSDHGAELLVRPHRGLLYARFSGDPEDGEARVERAFRAARLAARAGRGSWRVEDAPLAIREVREVFGDCESQVPLFRALKAQYDPRGILNPGRHAGRV